MDHQEQFRRSDNLEFKKLFELIHCLRAQTQELSNIFGPSQLFSLAFLFSLTIISYLMVMQSSKHNTSVPIVQIVASIDLLQYVRLLTMSYLTEQVSKKVNFSSNKMGESNCIIYSFTNTEIVLGT